MPTMVDGIWRACAFASSNWLMFFRSQRLVAMSTRRWPRCIDQTLDINDNFGMASNVLAGARPARLAAQEMAGIQIYCTT